MRTPFLPLAAINRADHIRCQFVVQVDSVVSVARDLATFDDQFVSGTVALRLIPLSRCRGFGRIFDPNELRLSIWMPFFSEPPIVVLRMVTSLVFPLIFDPHVRMPRNSQP